MQYQLVIRTKTDWFVWSKWINESTPNTYTAEQIIPVIMDHINNQSGIDFETDTGHVIVPHDVLKESIISIEIKE